MAFLSWHDQYLIGDNTIDNEHKQLFVLINEFHNNWIEQRQKQAAAVVLNRLVQYAETHFQHEEDIMAAANFPELAQHAEVHAKVTETIFTLYAELVEDDKHMEHDLLKFLKSWLIDHIVQCDYKFRSYLQQKHALPEAA